MLAQYPVPFVLGGRQNGPAGNHRAPERHDDHLFGARCRGANGEKGAEKPTSRSAPVGVHAFCPVTAWIRRIASLSPNCVGPWRLCGGFVYCLSAASSRRLCKSVRTRRAGDLLPAQGPCGLPCLKIPYGASRCWDPGACLLPDSIGCSARPKRATQNELDAIFANLLRKIPWRRVHPLAAQRLRAASPVMDGNGASQLASRRKGSRRSTVPIGCGGFASCRCSRRLCARCRP